MTSFAVGDFAEIERDITAAVIDAFAELSGDDNPLHMSDAAARDEGFPGRVAHGAITIALLSTLIGTKLPGIGALWQKVNVEWQKPVFIGDRVKLRATVAQVSSTGDALKLTVAATNQHGTIVMKADATVGISTTQARSTSPARAQAPSSPATDSIASKSATPGAREVLVTGASGGIGRACALALARSGFDVVVGFHSREERARAVVDEIRGLGLGRNARSLAIDVGSNLVDVGANATHRVRDELHNVVALVHAASPPLIETTALADHDEALERYFHAYVRASLQLVRAMSPAMERARFGRVVLLGTSAIVGAPPAKMAAYVTAKSALVGLVRALALELGPIGATANLVSPGLTPTELVRDVSPRVQMAEAQRNPTRRNATPDDTAALVAFLCSAAAAYLNGAHLPVTGGAPMT